MHPLEYLPASSKPVVVSGDQIESRTRLEWHIGARPEANMKTLLKIAGAVVICMVLLLATARVTGFEPGACPNPGESWTCRVPGLWLRGNLVTTPVNDWSFTDEYQNAKLQTRDLFGFPHSIGTYL